MRGLLALLLLLLLTLPVLLSGTLPGGRGIAVGGDLPADYEPSGIDWHPYFGALFLVSDEGVLSRLDVAGGNLQHWQLGGDLEGVTVADPASPFVYAAVEYPPRILQFDAVLGRVTRSIDPSDALPPVADRREFIEALTFVPNGDHGYPDGTGGGLFYVGLQDSGTVYVLDLDFTAGTARRVASFTPRPGRADLSGLHYHRDNQVLYVLYDSADTLSQFTPRGGFISEHSVPGRDQEGITLLPGCPDTALFIAEDSGRVMRYDHFPVPCLGDPAQAGRTPGPAAPVPFTAPTPHGG